MQPLDFYLLILYKHILNCIVKETNKCANQKMAKRKSTVITPHSRLNAWEIVSVDEIKQFLGILVWTGLDKRPSIKIYWSTNILYSNKISASMSHNRFENILATIHFANNETAIF